MAARSALAPVPDLSGRDLSPTVSPAGTTWSRLYLSRYPEPLGWGFGVSRFSDPHDEFGVVYFGESLKVCLLEVMLGRAAENHQGTIEIAESELFDWRRAIVRQDADLKLVDLRGDGLVRLGMPSDALRHSVHGQGGQWARAIWRHADGIDGLIFPSRHNGETNIVLYDRALPGLTAVESRPLLEYPAELTKVFRELPISLI